MTDGVISRKGMKAWNGISGSVGIVFRAVQAGEMVFIEINRTAYESPDHIRQRRSIAKPNRLMAAKPIADGSGTDTGDIM